MIIMLGEYSHKFTCDFILLHNCTFFLITFLITKHSFLPTFIFSSSSSSSSAAAATVATAATNFDVDATATVAKY